MQICVQNIEINSSSTDESYNTIAEFITTTAQQVLGKYRKKKQPCISDDILILCDK